MPARFAGPTTGREAWEAPLIQTPIPQEALPEEVVALIDAPRAPRWVKGALAVSVLLHLWEVYWLW